MGLSTFNVLSLCSGIGGLDLGIKLACPDSRTICYCERESHSIQVLAARIKDGFLDDAPIWSNVKTFDGNPWCGKVDCLAGSYPCQPFSCAGKQQGEQDPRHLFPDFRRIIEEVQPEWCFFENVANHLQLGFEQVKDDLQKMGYEVAAGIFSAAEVGAPHKRERLFILSHSKSFRRTRTSSGDGMGGEQLQATFLESEQERRENIQEGEYRGIRYHIEGGSNSLDNMVFPPYPDEYERWEYIFNKYPEIKPALCRTNDGATGWVDRCRACGNAVMPLVAAHAWKILEKSLI